MANSKSIYLNESASNRIENIKAFFNKFRLTPSDSSIISAALEVYEKTLKDNDIRRLDEVEKSEGISLSLS